jgi:hypothetical protein
VASNPCLAVGQQQLALFCHTTGQRAALALPGCDVVFVQGHITDNQVLSQRPGYINVILIQSRGAACTDMDLCFQCQQNPGQGLFLECRSLLGHFGGCCDNCKWCDHVACCTLTFALADNDDSSDSEVDDNDGDCTRSIKSEAKDDGCPRRKLLGRVDASGSETQVDPWVL